VRIRERVQDNRYRVFIKRMTHNTALGVVIKRLLDN
jgi:hypothetical protein